MKGLPKDFPDANDHRYWSGPNNANPDEYNYDPSHTVFFIRDYMKDVKTWFNSHASASCTKSRGENEN